MRRALLFVVLFESFHINRLKCTQTDHILFISMYESYESVIIIIFKYVGQLKTVKAIARGVIINTYYLYS